jgi:hypothetical protein
MLNAFGALQSPATNQINPCFAGWKVVRQTPKYPCEPKTSRLTVPTGPPWRSTVASMTAR